MSFMDQMLDYLMRQDWYYFRDDYFGYNQNLIAPEDQERTNFTIYMEILHSHAHLLGYVMPSLPFKGEWLQYFCMWWKT